MSSQTNGVETEEVDRTAPVVEPLLTEAQARERSRELRKCYQQLWSATPATRVEAVKRLTAFGATALKPLQRAVVDLEPQVQLAAVQALREIGGPGAVSLLLKAIQSDQVAVRLVAAEGLGGLAGGEALEPLKRAYRQCYIGGSVRRELAIVPSVFLLFVGGLLYCLRSALSGNMVSAFPPFELLVMCGAAMTGYVFGTRSRRNARTIMDALLKVAARSSHAKLDDLLPELRILAGSRWMSDPDAREAARMAKERIEGLPPVPLRDLPVPSAAVSPSGEILPVPAGAPPSEAQPRSGVSS